MASVTKTGCQFTIITKRVKGVVPWIWPPPNPANPVLEISHVAWHKWRDLGMDSTGIPAHTKRMGWGGRGRIIYQVLLLCVFVFETVPKVEILGGGFINNCLFLPRSLGKRNSHFDEHFFQMGRFRPPTIEENKQTQHRAPHQQIESL